MCKRSKKADGNYDDNLDDKGNDQDDDCVSAAVYSGEMRRLQRAHVGSYCQYVLALGLGAGNCSLHDTGDNSPPRDAVVSPGCQFTPLRPKLYKR